MAARAHDLEEVTEEFNAARDQLAAQEAKARAAAGHLRRRPGRARAAQQQVRGIARSAYTGDRGSFAALITSRAPTTSSTAWRRCRPSRATRTHPARRPPARTWPPPRRRPRAQKAAPRRRATFDEVAAQQADLRRRSPSTRRTSTGSAPPRSRPRVAGGRRPRQPGAADRSRRRSRRGPVVADSQAAQIAVDTAMAQRGKPYVWAAAGPGSFDCSGLVAVRLRRGRHRPAALQRGCSRHGPAGLAERAAAR